MDHPENLSPLEKEPSQEFVSARARRRRALRRAYFPSDEGERSALFAHLANRAFPSSELFIFALVAGAIMGLGYFLDSQSLLIFGVLVAPLLTPWIGLALGTVAGAGRMFIQTLIALLISSGLLFLGGAIAGYATRIFPQPRTFNEAFLHSRLWAPDFFVLAVGAVLITLSFVRSEQRPYLPSALVAYEFFLPLCAAGFGLGSGIEGLWPPGLQVFLVHVAWGTLFSILTLFFLRFFPTSLGGFSFTSLVLVALIAWISLSTGALDWARIQAGLSPLQLDPAIQSTPTLPLVPTISPTSTPEPVTSLEVIPSQTPSQTPTRRPTSTIPPTQTPTLTVTAEPTPIIALVRASEGGGAFVRETPGGQGIIILPNGWSVTIVPNDIQEVNGVIWVHVIANINDTRVDGWMIQSLLVTATPVPDWQPTATSPSTSTP